MNNLNPLNDNAITNLLDTIPGARDASIGARRLAGRYLREALTGRLTQGAYDGTDVADLDKQRTASGKPSHSATAVAKEVSPDVMGFILHILAQDVEGTDETSGGRGIARLLSQTQQVATGDAVILGTIGADNERPTGAEFRARMDGETWREYYAARKTWARNQDDLADRMDDLADLPDLTAKGWDRD